MLPIQFNNFANLHNGIDTFFCKTDYLPQLFAELQNYEVPSTLISGNSDYPIVDGLVDMAPSCITRWFGQCINTDKTHVFPLPYGLENTEECIRTGHGVGYPERICKVETAKNPPQRTPLKSTYANFGLNTHGERKELSHICKQASHITCNIAEVCWDRPYDIFVNEVLDHEMVVCPRGNAPAETHRFWEVLYMNRIPIIKLNKGNSFFTELPVIVLNDWNQLEDTTFLLEELKRVKNNPTRMLDMSYWVDLILKKYEN